jgi:methyl-accepting chemotaxis protein
VNIAVNQMDETAQQNAALVQQSSAATRSLEEQSRELIEAMSSFKLSAQTA